MNLWRAEGVALYLEAHPDIEIVASCASGSEAIRLIRERAPDLVLLDVKMPGLSGFDVIESIGVEQMPPVIFLTAYEDYALRAFRVAAVDYLLKPIDEQRLNEALERARMTVASKDMLERANALSSALQRLPQRRTDRPHGDRVAVRSGGSTYFLRPQEILWVEASGDYVTDSHGRAAVSGARSDACDGGATRALRLQARAPVQPGLVGEDQRVRVEGGRRQ